MQIEIKQNEYVVCKINSHIYLCNLNTKRYYRKDSFDRWGETTNHFPFIQHLRQLDYSKQTSEWNGYTLYYLKTTQLDLYRHIEILKEMK